MHFYGDKTGEERKPQEHAASECFIRHKIPPWYLTDLVH